ncbi:MAG: autotransporter adhesin family protein [Bacteroidales bacterium]|nr:autotransporter adhesin family protein [Bacteroidales bacterium]
MLKNTFVLILSLLCSIHLFSQSQGINYQALLIDNDAKEIPGVDIEGSYMPNQQLTIRFSIIDENGIVNYQEEHQTQTDDYGMINLVIGEGTPTAQSAGNFEDIDWNGAAKNLLVEISLGATTNNFEEFSSEKLHFVPYAYHRNITATGTMIIDGSSTLNDTLTVANGSPTFLTGNLAVDGSSTFNGLVTFQDILVEDSTNLNGILNVNNGSPTYLSGNLTVEQTSNLNGVLNVNASSNLNGDLNVNNGSATNLSGNLTVQQTTHLQNTLTVDATSSLNGRVTINANVNGNQSSKNSYPLRIQGSNQGIAITVDGGRNTGKNFITFWDANGAHGRIEGQTSSELHNSFDYIWDQTYESLMTATQTALVVADVAGVDDGDAAVVEGVQMVAEIAHFAKRNVKRENSIGIAFESGGADYAEWLEKAYPDETFSFGDIVGVKGGKIAKNMPGADSYMVVSKNPVVLGNMPPKGQEINYEKVAFMGQVPVKVRGIVNIGDYIIASGLNDGFGRAVSPEKISINEYVKIVGIAWSASGGNGSYSMINVAVGINTGALVSVIKSQKAEIEGLKKQLGKLDSFLSSKFPDYKPSEYKVSNENTDKITQTDNVTKTSKNNDSKMMIVNLLENNPEVLNNIMKTAREDLDKKGINYNLFEQTKELANNPDYLIQLLKEK